MTGLTASALTEKRALTRDELEKLFTALICNTCPATLHFMTTNELQRMVSLVLYRRNCIDGDKKRGEVVNSLTVLMSKGEKTIRSWIYQARDKGLENPRVNVFATC